MSMQNKEWKKCEDLKTLKDPLLHSYKHNSVTHGVEQRQDIEIDFQ